MNATLGMTPNEALWLVCWAALANPWLKPELQSVAASQAEATGLARLDKSYSQLSQLIATILSPLSFTMSYEHGHGRTSTYLPLPSTLSVPVQTLASWP